MHTWQQCLIFSLKTICNNNNNNNHNRHHNNDTLKNIYIVCCGNNRSYLKTFIQNFIHLFQTVVGCCWFSYCKGIFGLSGKHEDTFSHCFPGLAVEMIRAGGGGNLDHIRTRSKRRISRKSEESWILTMSMFSSTYLEPFMISFCSSLFQQLCLCVRGNTHASQHFIRSKNGSVGLTHSSFSARMVLY